MVFLTIDNVRGFTEAGGGTQYHLFKEKKRDLVHEFKKEWKVFVPREKE